MQGGNFVQNYVVLRKGCLEIYENKDKYDHGDNMKERVKLLDMRLSVKLKEFHHDYSSLNLVRPAVMCHLRITDFFNHQCNVL